MTFFYLNAADKSKLNASNNSCLSLNVALFWLLAHAKIKNLNFQGNEKGNFIEKKN